MSGWRGALADRIALVRERVTGTDVSGRVDIPFELDGTPLTLVTDGGLPRELTDGEQGAPWALVVDDPELIVPLHDPRPLSSVDACAIRIAGEMHALPMVHEVRGFRPEIFHDAIRGTRLDCFQVTYGSPVGSLHHSFSFRDGVPVYTGDEIDIDRSVPFMAAGLDWPSLWAYRHGQFDQVELLLGGWVDAGWQDLLAVHGLYDADGFARIYASYPDLPAELLIYCRVLGAAVEKRRPEGMTGPDGPGAT